MRCHPRLIAVLAGGALMAVAAGGTSASGAVRIGNWGTITHAAIFDASTGGNMLAWAPLTTSRTINDGDVFRIPAESLTVTLT